MHLRYLVIPCVTCVMLPAICWSLHVSIPTVPPSSNLHLLPAQAPHQEIFLPRTRLSTNFDTTAPDSSQSLLSSHVRNWFLVSSSDVKYTSDQKQQSQQQQQQQTKELQIQVAPAETVLLVLKQNSDAIILDARRAQEIVDSGYIHVPGHHWIYASCSLEECSLLEKTVSDLIPDHTSKFFSS